MIAIAASATLPASLSRRVLARSAGCLPRIWPPLVVGLVVFMGQRGHGM
jgi:hypothetical protein